MVPLIGQCLLPWGSEKLGLPSCTESVCDKGCALTSTAMVFRYYGVDTNPDKLNKCLKTNKGFSECLIRWDVAANNCSEKKVEYTSMSRSLLDQELDAGHPVILHVPGTKPNHFVVATSRMDDTYYINDPLNYGDRTTLKKYGNTFNSIRMFRPRNGDLNIALGKPVTVTTNGADEPHEHVGEWPSDITDGSLDYQPVSSGIEDGCVGWVNDDYDELMVVTVTIDLQGTYNINKIRYNMGNCQRAETWNADRMESPFGRTTTNPGTPYSGAWTEQAGDITASSVTIKFEKTRTAWERDWLFIGEIEVWGTPVETPEKIPIILVHGYFGGTDIWDKPDHLIDYLKFFGGYEPDEIFTLDLEPTIPDVIQISNGNIRTYAGKLSDKVEDVKSLANANKVDIAAHDMGGLVARWYIEKGNGDENVRKLIMVGTPNQGSVYFLQLL